MRPVGELDLATVPLVDAELAELWSVGFTRLVVDLRSMTFLDSTALGMLLTWTANSAADGLVFGVIPGPPVVERVLEVAGVDEQLSYCPPPAHALQCGRPRTEARGAALRRVARRRPDVVRQMVQRRVHEP